MALPDKQADVGIYSILSSHCLAQSRASCSGKVILTFMLARIFLINGDRFCHVPVRLQAKLQSPSRCRSIQESKNIHLKVLAE